MSDKPNDQGHRLKTVLIGGALIVLIAVSAWGISNFRIVPRNSNPVVVANEPPLVASEGQSEAVNVEVVQEAMNAPSLHHADSHAPEEGYGSFDVGVHADQIGIVFGWHILWPTGGYDAGGGGCNLVILTPGWYEDLQILDGRYEVYDIPLADYEGWVEVLGQQRADEQAADYGCPVKVFGDLPQWESPIPSPP